MKIEDLIVLLQAEMAAHPGIEVHTGGVEGDVIDAVWFDPGPGCVYVG